MLNKIISGLVRNIVALGILCLVFGVVTLVALALFMAVMAPIAVGAGFEPPIMLLAGAPGWALILAVALYD